MAGIGAIGSYGSLFGYSAIYQNRTLYQAAYQNRNANPTSTEPVSGVSRLQTTPVPPVDRVPTVQRGAAQTIQEDSPFVFPTMREGADPAEMAVRARIQYLDGKAEDLERDLVGWNQSKGLERLLNGEESGRRVTFPWDQEEALEAGTQEEKVQEDQEKTPQEVVKESECQTCKHRKYQDGSDDPGVSFQTPTTVAPEQAAAAVRGHEQEHVVREQAKAIQEDRKVVSQSVTIHTEICPECGDVYVSGGTTRTVTKANPTEEPQQSDNEKKSGMEAVA